MYLLGASVGFYLGDIRRLSDDMKALRPTVTPAVPRLLNRIYDKVQADVSGSCIKKLLYNMAMSAKESEIKRYVVNDDYRDALALALTYHDTSNNARF